jgi:hypothetical protein
VFKLEAFNLSIDLASILEVLSVLDTLILLVKSVDLVLSVDDAMDDDVSDEIFSLDLSVTFSVENNLEAKLNAGLSLSKVSLIEVKIEESLDSLDVDKAEETDSLILSVTEKKAEDPDVNTSLILSIMDDDVSLFS